MTKFIRFDNDRKAFIEDNIRHTDIDFNGFDINDILPQPIDGNILAIEDNKLTYKTLPFGVLNQLKDVDKYLLAETTIQAPYDSSIIINHTKDLYNNRKVLIYDQDDNLIPEDFEVELTSSTTTTIRDLDKLNNIYQSLKIVISCPIYRDTRDFRLTAYGKYELEFPFNIENGVISLLETKSSTSTSDTSYRVSFLDKSKYILDYTIGNIDSGVLVYKPLQYNATTYYSNYELIVKLTQKFDLYFVHTLKSVTLKANDNGTNSDIKFAFVFGNTYVGYDYNNNTLIEFQNIDDIKHYGIDFNDINNIDLSTLTNYGNIFSLLLYVKNNDNSGVITDAHKVRDYTLLKPTENIGFNDSNKSVKYNVDSFQYGHFIKIHNPNTYDVENIPILVDLSDLQDKPQYFKLVDVITKEEYQYYFVNKYGTYQPNTVTDYIFVKIPKIKSKGVVTIKLLPLNEEYIPETKPADIHEYIIDPYYGFQLYATYDYEVHPGTGFKLYTWRRNSYYYYLPQVELLGKDFIIHAKKLEGYAQDNQVIIQFTSSPTNRIYQIYGSYYYLYVFGKKFIKQHAPNNTNHHIYKFSLDTNAHACISVYSDVYGLMKECYKATNKSNNIRDDRISPYIYLYPRSSGRHQGMWLCVAYTRPLLEQELEIIKEYRTYPQSENVDIVIDTPYIIPDLKVKGLSIKPIVKNVVGDLSYLVSSDKQTWYYIDSNGNFVEYDNNNTIPLNTSINVDLYKQQFNTNEIYFRFLGNISDFEIMPKVTIENIPIKTPIIDDIVIEYTTNGYLTNTDGIEMYINNNKMIVINKTEKDKYLKLNIII